MINKESWFNTWMGNRAVEVGTFLLKSGCYEDQELSCLWVALAVACF